MNGPSCTKCDFQGMKAEKSTLPRVLQYTNKFCRKMIQQMLKNIYIFPILYTFINTLTKNNIQTLRKLNNFGSRGHSFLLTYK